MPAKRQPARRKPAARKHPAKRVKIPKGGPVHARLAGKLMLHVAAHLDTHGDTVRSRKDAAILRATHQGCPTCKGNGQIFTKGKDGSFTGSKPCPAKPTVQKVSKWAVYKASRFGADKSTGLVGWACPCGKKEKPRYRDAREATKALRTHERQKHGGKSVGGTWYAQATTETPTPGTSPKPAASTPRPKQTSARAASQPQPKTAIAVKDKPVSDYNRLTTPLPTGRQYAYSVTLAHHTGGYGLRPSHDVTGTYTPPEGATVATFHTGIKAWYAQQHRVPVDEVLLVRCELTEK
ncbi:hypothetical protein [Streptomyces luteogriseus]|uniref:hypothetical protein n=1 Tax=Streptomyces luteogriseus TaxID=68233 RepID=UPI0038304A8D